MMKSSDSSAREVLRFEDVQFDPQWEYHNPETGFRYKSGVIPGKLIYSTTQGNVNISDARESSKTLHRVYETGGFRDTNPIRITDYSGITGASLAAKKHYAQTIKKLNESFNCEPKATYVCGANLITRSAIRIFASFMQQAIYYVDSVDEAFEHLQSVDKSAGTSEKNITVSQKDIDEIEGICGDLLWGAENENSQKYTVSSKNPLAQLVETLALVKRDIVELREHDGKQAQSLKDVFEAIQVGLVIVDAKTHEIVFANAGAAAISQTVPEKMTGKKCHEYICPAEKGRCPITDLGKSVENADREMLRADGSSCPVLKSVKRFEYRERPCLLETFIDTTEMTQARAEREKNLQELEKNKTMLLSMMEDTEAARAQSVESENRLDLAMSVANDGIWDWDIANDTIYFDPRYYTMAGYEPNEFPGTFEQWEKRVHHDDLKQSALAVEQHLTGDCKTFDTEFRFLRKDGDYMWIRARGNIVARDEKGNPQRFVGTHSDITKRKLSDEALRESEQNFHTFFSTVDEMIMVGTPTGRLLYTNQAVSEKLGYSQEELLSMHVLDVHSADKRQQAENSFAAVIRDGRSTCTIPLEAKNGTQISVDTRVWSGSWNGKPSIFSISKDLSEQQRLMLELNQIKQAVDASSNAIGISTATGYHFYQNETFTSMFGYDTEELGTLSALCLYADSEIAKEVFETIMAGGSCDREIEMVAKSGRHFPVHLRADSIKNDQGEVTGLVGAHVDITERKLAEYELSALNQSLEQQTTLANTMASEAEAANAAKSEFLANMSHEIRTPMNGVIGMTGLLLDTELDDEQRRYAETVRASADSLLSLINDILDFSKIEAGKLQIEVLDFDLRTLLDDFAEMMALKVHEKELEFICAASPEVPALLQGDPGRLRQVLINLVGNAIKFTKEGEIAVRVNLESETEKEVLVRFSVHDTGIGIPADRQDNLFEHFTQVDASTTRKYGGTGLGLAISKQLSAAMGGQIGVNSEEGKGTEFWFTAHFAKQPERQTDLTSPTDLHDVRILVVDNNATSREILLKQLSAWGASLEEAPDGKTGLELLREAAQAGEPYNLAIIDMQLRGTNGEELGKAIREDTTLTDTQLMMMTAVGLRGDAKRLEKIGFAAYLTKPVRQSDLFDSLVVVLAGKTHKAGRSLVTRHSIREIRRGNVRILLAEDNLVNQRVALGILKKLGLSADAVPNGARAVSELEKIPYDLVLMDCQMPEMDGYEATGCIRDPKSAVLNHDIPIIAMTANAMLGDKEKCLDAGMSDYIAKPVKPQILAEMLNKWLPDKNEIDDQVNGSGNTEEPDPADGENANIPTGEKVVS